MIYYLFRQQNFYPIISKFNAMWPTKETKIYTWILYGESDISANVAVLLFTNLQKRKVILWKLQWEKHGKHFTEQLWFIYKKSTYAFDENTFCHKNYIGNKYIFDCIFDPNGNNMLLKYKCVLWKKLIEVKTKFLDW